MKVLHIDDDVELGEMLCLYLQGEGFEAEHCADPLEGVQRLAQGGVHLVVLDVMMPQQNGLETLRQIRQKYSTPVLMLTARGDDVDRIVGLELGADDYVPKPCLPREIVARIRAILRRSSGGALMGELLQLGPLELWSAKRRVLLAGEEVDLTSAEFNLLEVLVSRAGQVVSKAFLCEHGLGRSLEKFDRSIDVHLSSLRAKLGLAHGASSICLHTIRGQGYLLNLI